MNQHSDGGSTVFDLYPWVTRETPINESGLSVRLVNALNDRGFDTVGKAINLSRVEFAQLKNVGASSWRELNKFAAAFARHEESRGSKPNALPRPSAEVTLRDYFAAQAPKMPDCIEALPGEKRFAEEGFDQPDEGAPDSEWKAYWFVRDRAFAEAEASRLATWSYYYADAMLAAREVKP